MENRIQRYFQLKKYSEILKNRELQFLIKEIIEGYEKLELQQVNNQEVLVFSNQAREKIQLELQNGIFIFTKYLKENYLEKHFVHAKSAHVESIQLERRPNGIILTKVDKRYDYTKFSSHKKQLVDLTSARYSFRADDIKCIFPHLNLATSDINYIFTTLIGTQDQILAFRNQVDFIGVIPAVTAYFEAHIKSYESMKNQDASYTTYLALNTQDISDIYLAIDGPNKLSRIYDLYNGIVTLSNRRDLRNINKGILSSTAFDLKTAYGITEEEDKIVGPSITLKSKGYYDFLTKVLREEYNTSGINLDSREEILKCIKSNHSTTSVGKTPTEKWLSHEEIPSLEQDNHKRIAEYRKVHKQTKKNEYN